MTTTFSWLSICVVFSDDDLKCFDYRCFVSVVYRDKPLLKLNLGVKQFEKDAKTSVYTFLMFGMFMYSTVSM